MNSQQIQNRPLPSKLLACFKRGASLAVEVAGLFKEVFDATFAASESDNEYQVAKIVKAQLSLLATDAGYDEAYAERVLSECLTVNGLVKPTANPRTGRPVVVVPESAYKAAAAAYDVIAGSGVSPSAKALRNVAKILARLGLDEGKAERLTISEVKAYRAPAPVATAAETEAKAGNVVQMPPQATKSGKLAKAA
jgi:hypothetical protein